LVSEAGDREKEKGDSSIQSADFAIFMGTEKRKGLHG